MDARSGEWHCVPTNDSSPFPFVLLLAAPSHAQDGPTTLNTRPVLLVEQPKADERGARLRALGMIELPELTVSGLRLSQLSGLTWDDDDGILYAISDKGALFHLSPVLREGKLAGLQLLKAVPLKEADGKPLKGRRADSEGLDILKGRNGRKGDAELVISFERFPRIVRYRTDGTLIGEYPLPAPLNDRKIYRDNNKMLESVCVDEKLGVLTMPEDPLAKERAGPQSHFPRRRRLLADPGDGPVPAVRHRMPGRWPRVDTGTRLRAPARTRGGVAHRHARGRRRRIHGGG